MPYIRGRLALWEAETLVAGPSTDSLSKPETGLIHTCVSELRVQYNFDGNLDI